MRSRHLAAVPAAIVLMFFAAGCGKKDDGTTANATTPIAVPTSPNAPDDGGGSGSTSTGDTTDPTATTGTGTPKQPPQAPSHKAKKGETIPVVAGKDSDLTNFVTALGAANLESTLGGGGPYTLFAPNNDGFAKLGTMLDTLLQPSSQDQLANILKFHIVKGRYGTKDLKDGELLTTLQGTRLRVDKKGDQVYVGNSQGKAHVVDSDIDATNGVINVVDTVLTPKTTS
ncbi:MAG: fasciclin domain-containing protein [Solirubrobacteraceae bacterium]|nr:fasciclin domain-containing protein [Patulibacter sp.]